MKKYVVVFLLCALLALSCASRPSHAAQPHMQKALVGTEIGKSATGKGRPRQGRPQGQSAGAGQPSHPGSSKGDQGRRELIRPTFPP